jgi:hypothetical protein
MWTSEEPWYKALPVDGFISDISKKPYIPFDAEKARAVLRTSTRPTLNLLLIPPRLFV